MVTEEKILQKLIQVDEYLSFLNKISKTSEQDFLKDKIYNCLIVLFLYHFYYVYKYILVLELIYI